MARNPLLNFSIPRRGRSCAHSGQKLEPGAEYLSILTEGASEGELVREDILYSWWQEHGSTAELEAAKSSWRGKVPACEGSPVTKEEYLERAFELLYEYLKAEERIKAFLVALYLARKKKLLLRQEMVAEGRTTYLYEVAETEEIIPIEVVEPSADDIENLQKILNDEIGFVS